MRIAKFLIFLALAAFFIFGNFVIPRFFQTSSSLERRLDELYLENQSLRAKSVINLPSIESKSRTARVYSSYPFNDRNVITLALGSGDGIKESMPVVLGPNVLIGQVTEVYEKYSLAQTVFDADWRSAVRVGNNNINALLEGGSAPRLTTIDKNKMVKEGDFIYSAAKGFPYGALVGKVKKIITSPSAIFQEAEIELPYDWNNEIVEVAILTSYVR